MPYNPQKHQRRSIRLQGYDYSQAGLYFITICVQDRKHLFGEIVAGEMILSKAGLVADKCWLDIPLHFPNAVLHEHIVMPNHLHGIIELVKDETITRDTSQQHAFQKMIPRSVSSIVKGFKIGVTNWVRENIVLVNNELPFKVWQRNYYEHIIRNEISFFQIAFYIENNPKNWKEDRFFNETD